MKEVLLHFLKGAWMKHPLHPVVVHVPVAVWPAALLFDALSRWDVGGNATVRLSFVAISLGLLTMFLAVPTGLVEWSGIKKKKPAWKLGLYHMVLNLVAVLLYAVNFGLRVQSFQTATAVERAPFILSAIGTGLLVISTYLGGLMVYDHGTSVARLSKQKWRKRAQTERANVPEA